MSSNSFLARRPTTVHTVAVILLVSALAVVLGLWVSGEGAAAQASVSAGVTPSGGSGASDAPGSGLPSEPATGYDEDGSPHADTSEEMMGSDLSAGQVALIVAVVVVALAIVVTLTLRGRRKRAASNGDLQ